MSRPNNVEETQKIRKYVELAEAEVNKLGVRPRAARKYPFDIVGLAILSKSFALAKACLELLDVGLPDEAYGLSRSLVECATNLRYLTSVPALQDQRTHAFVKFSMADKQYWLCRALEQFSGRKEETEIRAYAKQEGILADSKAARRYWSGMGSGFVWIVAMCEHPLDGPTATLTFKKSAFATDYYQTSSFVPAPGAGGHPRIRRIRLRNGSLSARYE